MSGVSEDSFRDITLHMFLPGEKDIRKNVNKSFARGERVSSVGGWECIPNKGRVS